MSIYPTAEGFAELKGFDKDTWAEYSHELKARYPKASIVKITSDDIKELFPDEFDKHDEDDGPDWDD